MASFYSSCTPLTLNCYLFIDPELTTLVPIGFYSDGNNCYQVDFTGKIIAVTTCVLPCDLTMGNITSTDPTSIGGTDGTITVNFTTTHGPSTYTLNGATQGAAVNPLVVTGLSSNIAYTIIITDSNGCSVSATVTLGQSATLFEADWIMATYEFQDGTDLDTRSKMVVPDIGQSSYLGWNVFGGYDPINGSLHYSAGGGADPNSYLLLFGGDNTGNGFESVLVNVKRFKAQFPSATEFTLDLRGFWYNHSDVNPGVLPVNVGVILWKDAVPAVGAPVHNGCFFGGKNWCWTYPGAAFFAPINSVPKVISLIDTNSSISGVRIATLKYNLNTFVTILNNADDTTPS